MKVSSNNGLLPRHVDTPLLVLADLMFDHSKISQAKFEVWLPLSHVCGLYIIVNKVIDFAEHCR